MVVEKTFFWILIPLRIRYGNVAAMYQYMYTYTKLDNLSTQECDRPSDKRRNANVHVYRDRDENENRNRPRVVRGRMMDVESGQQSEVVVVVARTLCAL